MSYIFEITWNDFDRNTLMVDKHSSCSSKNAMNLIDFVSFGDNNKKQKK